MMFGIKSEAKSLAKIDSLIGAGVSIEGTVRFAGGLRVDGEIRGSVEGADEASGTTLVVSEHARIEGGVNVAHLVLNGVIVGPVRVSETLEMQAKARISGDVEYGLIEMRQGAVIEGRLMLLPGKTVELKLAASN
jgi:cytoskeletal protein CcmA (bactofilin family)